MLPDTVQFNHWLFSTREKDFKTRFAVFVANIVITPFVLVALSIHIYFIPCIQAVISSICCRILFTDDGCLSLFKRWLYCDKEFPPNKDSLGNIKLSGINISWKRAKDIVLNEKGRDGKPKTLDKVFEHGIDASDICQGQLGDCWLLSALAALAEQPATIQNCFLTDSFNPRGKYGFRLWDDAAKQFVTLYIDDFIPVNEKSGKPVFSSPSGNEMWVMLLEKAIAKLCGSYANIEGGFPLFAMRAITGDEVCSFQYDRKNDAWNKLDMKVMAGKGKPDINFYHSASQAKTKSDAFYEYLVDYVEYNFYFKSNSL
jgi:hypothetical protein